MIIRTDLKREHVTSHVPLPEADETVPDVTVPKRKVTDKEVLQFFARNTESTYIDAAEELQVTRQTIQQECLPAGRRRETDQGGDEYDSGYKSGEEVKKWQDYFR